VVSAGAFVGPDSKTLPVPEGLPNAHMRLFGGAQYHRAMAEFRASIGELTCPDIRSTLLLPFPPHFTRQSLVAVDPSTGKHSSGALSRRHFIIGQAAVTVLLGLPYLCTVHMMG